MNTQTQTMTAGELLRLPDDGFRHELVRGELHKMSPAGHRHGSIVVNLATPLDQHVRANNLGRVYAAETGFKIASNPDTVRAPDVAFVSLARVEAAGETDGYFPGAPDLAVEVISPRDIYTEVEEKVFDWLEAGTRMVIVINPRQRAVTVYRTLTEITVFKESDQIEGGDVVPGWSMLVAGLFS